MLVAEPLEDSVRLHISTSASPALKYPDPRYTLNLKGLAYKTEWVEYPDIEALCKKIGAAPTGKWPDGADYYSLPVIYDPSTKKVVSDSFAIARYLDETYPTTPTLVPAGTAALQALFLNWAWEEIGLPTFAMGAVTLCKGLNPASQKHFREKREWQIGAPLEVLASAPEEKLAVLEKNLEKLKRFIEANGEGKGTFLGGDNITFADIQVASYLVTVRLVVPEVWAKISVFHGGKWAQLLEHLGAYEAVDV